ncbi:hypothetical protein BH11BAC1_BH11BAC1_04570 [soil metagenome]
MRRHKTPLMKKSIFLLTFICMYVNAGAQQSGTSHPEKGILPFNAPCKDCTEEIEKRTGNAREFLALNADGSKSIYIQKSLGNMNFKDAEGFWRTKDPRLVQESEHVFAARMQPSPVLIDFENKFSSITNSGKEFRFNKNISLVHIAASGAATSLGEGNWSSMTKTDNYLETIFLVSDFYPGIDLQMIVCTGRLKTNFILKNPLQFTDGWLAMRQEVDIPAGLSVDLSQTSLAGEAMRSGRIGITDNLKHEFFYFGRSNAYDAQDRTDNFIEMLFKIDGNQLDYFVPVNWLNNPSILYPVTIDPLVSTSVTYLQSSISGSGFTNFCDSLGCSYFLDSVMTPPNCEITGINTYFSYLSALPCIRDDGGFGITMSNPLGSSCTTRHFTCLSGIQGACFFWPVQLLNAVPPLFPCVFPPQCTPYPLNFELKFRRCNWLPVVPCDNTCVSANSDWIITIEGITVGISSVSCAAANSRICEGSSTTLLAGTIGGAGPYNYSWQPGNLSGQTVTVSPDSTTRYLLTVTDNCGSTDTASINVLVIPKQNPGFAISPSDTACDGDVITFTANGSAAATSYDWIVNCPSTNSFFNQHVLSYTAPAMAGSCTATLVYQVVTGALTCNFDSTQNFVVELCSGINDYKSDNLVSSIYPNPTNGEVQIAFKGSRNEKNIQLINLLGEINYTKNGFKEDVLTLDLAGLSKGIYFAKISNGDHFSIHKIILY